MLFGREKYNQGDILECVAGMLHHFGVYVGNGNVIHFASDSHGEIINPEGAYVKKTSLRRFSRGEDIFVNNSASRLPVSRIVANAESKLGSNLGGYSQMVNNSEHFARWCETGQKSSTTRNNITNGLASILKTFLT